MSTDILHGWVVTTTKLMFGRLQYSWKWLVLRSAPDGSGTLVAYKTPAGAEPQELLVWNAAAQLTTTLSDDKGVVPTPQPPQPLEQGPTAP